MPSPSFDFNNSPFGAWPKMGGGGIAKRPAPPPTPQEPDPEPLSPAAENPAPKDEPKVSLKNLAWSSPSVTLNEKSEVSLEADVPQSISHLTRIEMKAIAIPPNGKEEVVDRQEAFLKDGKARGQLTLFYPQHREGGALPASCKYVFSAKHKNSAEARSAALEAKQPFASQVRWEKPEEWFGHTIKLLANTCLKDGTEVTAKIASENGVALECKVKAAKGKLELPWTPCLCGVTAGADGKYPEKVEFYAELSYEGEKALPAGNFFLKAVGKTDSKSFSKDYTWGIFGVHSEFDQRLENGIADIQVRKTIMKAWPGYLVDMTAAGITGTAKGCPYEGNRWGRIIGAGDLPNQYHDGAKWKSMPAGFLPDDDMVSVYGFIKSGDKFKEGGEPASLWPEKFTEYDFDCAKYVRKRKDWIKDTDTRWSRKFLLRPKPCKHGTSTGGCGYPLDLKLELKKVDAWQAQTIAVCNGTFRSNAGCFSLEDPDINMVAHEVGHLVGMPDEYEGGGIDPAVNGDGAVNGIDTTTVMGNAMDKVKKRHYANFASMVGPQVGKKIGKDIAFMVGDL